MSNNNQVNEYQYIQNPLYALEEFRKKRKDENFIEDLINKKILSREKIDAYNDIIDYNKSISLSNINSLNAILDSIELEKNIKKYNINAKDIEDEYLKNLNKQNELQKILSLSVQQRLMQEKILNEQLKVYKFFEDINSANQENFNTMNKMRKYATKLNEIRFNKNSTQEEIINAEVDLAMKNWEIQHFTGLNNEVINFNRTFVENDINYNLKKISELKKRLKRFTEPKYEDYINNDYLSRFKQKATEQELKEKFDDYKKYVSNHPIVKSCQERLHKMQMDLIPAYSIYIKNEVYKLNLDELSLLELVKKKEKIEQLLNGIDKHSDEIKNTKVDRNSLYYSSFIKFSQHIENLRSKKEIIDDYEKKYVNEEDINKLKSTLESYQESYKNKIVEKEDQINRNKSYIRQNNEFIKNALIDNIKNEYGDLEKDGIIKKLMEEKNNNEIEEKYKNLSKDEIIEDLKKDTQETYDKKNQDELNEAENQSRPLMEILEKISNSTLDPELLVRSNDIKKYIMLTNRIKILEEQLNKIETKFQNYLFEEPYNEINELKQIVKKFETNKNIKSFAEIIRIYDKKERENINNGNSKKPDNFIRNLINNLDINIMDISIKKQLKKIIQNNPELSNKRDISKFENFYENNLKYIFEIFADVKEEETKQMFIDIIKNFNSIVQENNTEKECNKLNGNFLIKITNDIINNKKSVDVDLRKLFKFRLITDNEKQGFKNFVEILANKEMKKKILNFYNKTVIKHIKTEQIDIKQKKKINHKKAKIQKISTNNAKQMV